LKRGGERYKTIRLIKTDEEASKKFKKSVVKRTKRRTMKALCWYGTNDVRVENVPDPKIEDPRDAVIKITSTAICGSDLHLLDGYQPTMEKGDILGHENMGEVVEVGSLGGTVD